MWEVEASNAFRRVQSTLSSLLEKAQSQASALWMVNMGIGAQSMHQRHCYKSSENHSALGRNANPM